MWIFFTLMAAFMQAWCNAFQSRLSRCRGDAGAFIPFLIEVWATQSCVSHSSSSQIGDDIVILRRGKLAQ